MGVWEPWDADVEELSNLRVIRERIPPTMRPALKDWLFKRLHFYGGATSVGVVNELQTSLRVNFGLERGDVRTLDLVDVLESRGDKLLLRVVDWLLSQYETRGASLGWPPEVADIDWHLDTAMAAVMVSCAGPVFRLAPRLPEGVEEAAQMGVDASPKIAGEHLSKAIRAAQSLEPDASAVMTEAIRAVEAAAGPVVLPKEKRHQLGKIVQSLKAKAGWSLVLERRDDGVPDHRAVVIGMMETLAFAQRDRHPGGASPTAQQAMAHVLLAATLVGWFSTDTVQMNED